MTGYEQQLNDLLMRAYRQLGVIEQISLRQSRGFNLTISEIHLLEVIGPPRSNPAGKTISELSEYLGISLPSVTAGINKLVGKGYLVKEKGSADGRQVFVKMTHLGVKAEQSHRFFHRTMVRAIIRGMNEEERKAVLDGFIKLNAYFNESIEKGKGSI